MSEQYRWKKTKEKDIPAAASFLRGMEDDCVTACGRFLESPKGCLWKLSGENNAIAALLISSRSTLLPVSRLSRETPRPEFLKNLSRDKKIHSIQGLKNDVLVFEKEMEKHAKIQDIFDYDLMSLENFSIEKKESARPENLTFRVPQLADLDKIAKLQEGYEMEEVLPKGGTFNPQASRLNIANIIARGKILAAEIGGTLVGKINVSAVSFTRYLVGGVYTRPDYRGLGIAREMTQEFISSLLSEGRGITLFVKKNNPAAKKIYAGLGFTVRGDYRITYF